MDPLTSSDIIYPEKTWNIAEKFDAIKIVIGTIVWYQSYTDEVEIKHTQSNYYYGYREMAFFFLKALLLHIITKWEGRGGARESAKKKKKKKALYILSCPYQHLKIDKYAHSTQAKEVGFKQ